MLRGPPHVPLPMVPREDPAEWVGGVLAAPPAPDC